MKFDSSPPFSTINPLVSHFQSDPHIFPAQVPSQAFNLTLLIDAFVTSGLVKTSLEALGAGLSGSWWIGIGGNHGRYHGDSGI